MVRTQSAPPVLFGGALTKRHREAYHIYIFLKYEVTPRLGLPRAYATVAAVA